VAVGAALAVVLVVGARYAYRTLTAPPPTGIARLLPASTVAYLSFDASPEGDQARAAEQLRSTFEAQPGFREAWDRLTRPLVGALAHAGQEDPATSTPTGGPEDISQYIGGNVTVALLPPTSDDLQRLRDAVRGESSGVPEEAVSDVMGRNVVALVDLDFDALSKRGLLADLKRWAEQPSQAAATERYRDVDIRRFDTGTSAVYFALVGGSSTAIVAADPAPVRAVIDTYRDEHGLSNGITYNGLVDEVPTERVATLYVNLNGVYRAIRLAEPEAAASGPVRELRGAALLTLGAYHGGFRVDVATEADYTPLPGSGIDNQNPGGISINRDARPDVRTLADVPADAHAFLVGTDLRTPLNQLLDLAWRNRDSALADARRHFEARTGLNMDTDVAPLLQGDYVLSAWLKNAPDGSLAPSMVFELKVKDEARARAVLDKLAANSPDTRREKIAGADFYVSGGGLAYGAARSRVWVAWEGDGQGVAKTMAHTLDSVGKGVTTTAEWREEARVLPRYSNVIARVDLAALRGVVEASPNAVRDRQTYERNVAPFLAPLRYVLIGSASYAPERAFLSRNQTVVFVGVGSRQ
jgi:hypothetical protein